MKRNKEKRIIEIVGRLLVERDILNRELSEEEVVETRFEYSTPKERSELVKLIHEFRENGKVDWNRKVIKSN